MIKIENECVGCPPDLGCIGNSCHYLHVRRFYCDKCNCEEEELFWFEDEQLCVDCILEQLEKVIEDE